MSVIIPPILFAFKSGTPLVPFWRGEEDLRKLETWPCSRTCAPERSFVHTLQGHRSESMAFLTITDPDVYACDIAHARNTLQWRSAEDVARLVRNIGLDIYFGCMYQLPSGVDLWRYGKNIRIMLIDDVWRASYLSRPPTWLQKRMLQSSMKSSVLTAS